MLKLKCIIREERGRVATDRRRKLNSIIVEYIDQNGEIYRKRFSSYSKPIVPKQGTHDSLNALREQF